jgi:hypothetical protein
MGQELFPTVNTFVDLQLQCKSSADYSDCHVSEDSNHDGSMQRARRWNVNIPRNSQYAVQWNDAQMCAVNTPKITQSS